MKYTKQTQTHTYTQIPSVSSDINQKLNLPDQISFVLHLYFSFET